MSVCGILSTRVAILVGLAVAVAAAPAVAADPGVAPAPAPRPMPAPPAPPAFPSGATALTETYGDWSVICGVQGTARHCVARQEQINQQNRQLVLAIELTPAEEKVEGMAVLPFGLALERGVALQVDDLPAVPALPFRTCLPVGCLVPLAFEPRAVAILRAGTTLKAKVFIDGGAETTLPISLKGLATALDRTAALLASPERAVAQRR